MLAISAGDLEQPPGAFDFSARDGPSPNPATNPRCATVRLAVKIAGVVVTYSPPLGVVVTIGNSTLSSAKNSSRVQIFAMPVSMRRNSDSAWILCQRR